jgi:hypothetical protein
LRYAKRDVSNRGELAVKLAEAARLDHGHSNIRHSCLVATGGILGVSVSLGVPALVLPYSTIRRVAGGRGIVPHPVSMPPSNRVGRLFPNLQKARFLAQEAREAPAPAGQNRLKIIAKSLEAKVGNRTVALCGTLRTSSVTPKTRLRSSG